MNSLTDQQLLRHYTERRSEAAFAELVRRHVDLVYSAALRMVRDSHLAEDVTQGVFVALAKNAWQLTGRPVLSGWLHRTTQNLAANAVRSDVRRRAREQEAAAMNELLSAEPDAVWERIAPQLDAALGELTEVDRDALLLRYFERKSAREMAQTLGIGEDAAQKRVSRAVDRLREYFAKRGVTVGASGLVVVIAANAVQAAPIGLALTISTAAALAGTTLGATTTATAAKAFAMTTLQKTLVTAACIAAVGTGIYEARQVSQLRAENQALQQQQAPLTEQIGQLMREREGAANQLAALQEENGRLNRNTAELLRLRAEAGLLRRQLAEAARVKTQTSPQTTQQIVPDDPLEQRKRIARDKAIDGRNYATHFVLFAAENQGWFPTNWQQVVGYAERFPVSGTNEFEMVHKTPLNEIELGTNVTRTILVREYLAWPTPDAKWGKTYGYADGHSESVILPDGNFDAWEKQHTFDPLSGAK